jgi:cobalamin biosynthesis protein CobT
MTRVIMGRDDVFRRREIHTSRDVAVTLLVDCSGSMDLRDKIAVAASAAFALACVVERIGIPCEVLGFTTYGFGEDSISREELRQMREEERRMGRVFSRYEPLYIPIIKGFGERLTPQVKVRFPALYRRLRLLNNIDGECVEIAAKRLAKRRETRKVLMVLSDGIPYGYGNPAEQGFHLKCVVEHIGKQGVECIGIGIMDESVRHYYPKAVVLNHLADLPTTVMREITQVLLAKK